MTMIEFFYRSPLTYILSYLEYLIFIMGSYIFADLLMTDLRIFQTAS